MPYRLTMPRPAPVAATIRITSFAYSAESNVMRVEFVFETSDGTALERGSESFDVDDLAIVDKHGELRGSIKFALYALLALRRGARGTVE